MLQAYIIIIIQYYSYHHYKRRPSTFSMIASNEAGIYGRSEDTELWQKMAEVSNNESTFLC